MDIIEELIKTKKEKNVSSLSIAQKLDVPLRTIQHFFEKKQQLVRIELMYQICELLGLEIYVDDINNKSIILEKKATIILNLFDKGFSPNEISEKIKVSTSYARNILSKNNRKSRRADSDTLKRNQSIIDLYHSGVNVKDIAKQFNLTVKYISHNILKKNNIEVTLKRGPEIILITKEILKLYDSGISIEEICIKTNMNQNVIRQKLVYHRGVKFDTKEDILIRQKDDIKKWIKQGKSILEIHRIVNTKEKISYHTVYKFIKNINYF